MGIMKWTNEDTWVMLTLLKGGKKPRKLKKKLKKILTNRGIINPKSTIHALSTMKHQYDSIKYREAVEAHKEEAVQELRGYIKEESKLTKT